MATKVTGESGIKISIFFPPIFHNSLFVPIVLLGVDGASRGKTAHCKKGIIVHSRVSRRTMSLLTPSICLQKSKIALRRAGEAMKEGDLFLPLCKHFSLVCIFHLRKATLVFILVFLLSHVISNLSSPSCHIRVKQFIIPEQIHVLDRLNAREPALYVKTSAYY